MKSFFSGFAVLFAVLWIPSAGSVPCADEIVSILQEHAFVSGLKDPALFDADVIGKFDPEAFNEKLRGVDRYASYVPRTSFENFKKLQRSATAGVGMDIIRDRDGNVRCIPYPDSPADMAGIEYGDTLLAVDDLVVDDFGIEEIAFLIRGKKNSEVVLAVENSEGQVTTVAIEREENSYPPVVRTHKNPAVIKIFRFGTGTAKMLKKELEEFSSEDGHENRRLFLDLRGNTGGLLEQAALCAAMLLPKDAIIYRLNKGGDVTDVKTDGKNQIIKKSFAVLQDEFTASSAEMLISAVRASVKSHSYGTTSTGKARVQDTFVLSDGSVIKITTAELMFPDSEYTWQDAGLKPDIVKKQIRHKQ